MENQIRIAVLDDDMAEIHKTEQMLSVYEKTHPEHKCLVACYTETKTFMEAMCTEADIVEWAYDILLLDVYLPDGNGIKCGKILRDKGFAGVIICKSSTSENCLEAFEVDAMQYLIKPVSEEKLFETLDKAVEKIMDEPELDFENPNAPDVQTQIIQTKAEKRKNSVKEFFAKWLHTS